MRSERNARKSSPVGRRWPLASTAGRIRILLIVLAVLFSLAGARAAQFQVLDASDQAAEAADKLNFKHDLAPLRGQILDKDGNVLAFTEDTVDLVVYPNVIAGKGVDVKKASTKDQEDGAKLPGILAPVIARCTGLPAAQVLADLTAKQTDGSFKGYVKVATQVSIDTYSCIQTDPMIADGRRNGLGLGLTSFVVKESDPLRVYPMKTVASNVIGYLSNGKGGSGLEMSMDPVLTGKSGTEMYENSRIGKIPLGESTITPAVNGSTVTTTLDSGMCWQAQQLLDKRRAEMKQTWGFAVVMEVKTGKVLCLADTPSFDGNNVGAVAKTDPAALNNIALTSPYEPGSTVKMLTLATILDAGGATPDTITRVDSTSNGIKSGGHTIRDSENHPAVDYTTRGILVNSSNQGVIELARSTFSSKGQAGKQQYVDYMKSFGLGQKTDVGLPGENAGIFPADKILKDSYTMDSVAFGTSLSVNALQMAAAVNAVANDGVYVPPVLVTSTTAADGTVTPTPTQPSHRVIKSSTSAAMLGMMENRVLESYATIGIPGVRTAAKTGTAWQGKNMISSIMGLAPADNPQVLVYTVFYQKDTHSGAGITTAGPVYRDIMSLAIQRYGILPSANAAQYCIEQPLEAGDKPRKRC